jgi:short-subunit dehydrogenase
VIDFWTKMAGKDSPRGIALSSLPPERLMGVDEVVDAALAGLDQGELVTIPSLPDAAEWGAFTAARLALGPHLSLDHPADRYRPVQRSAA